MRRLLLLVLLALLIAPLPACDGEPDDSGCQDQDGTGCGPKEGLRAVTG